jgi:hypothetical protein
MKKAALLFIAEAGDGAFSCPMQVTAGGQTLKNGKTAA